MKDPLVYRTGANYLTMILWAVGVSVAFGTYFLTRTQAELDTHRGLLIAAGCGALISGPGCLTAYLLRRCFVYVEFAEEEGLRVSGRHILGWDQIREVQAVEGLLGLRTQKDPVVLSSAGGTYRPEGFSATLGRAMDADPRSGFWIVGLLMPFLALFTPWHPKVVITLADRTRLTFHELERDLEFTARCVRLLRTHRA